jgi:hypothetical protein
VTPDQVREWGQYASTSPTYTRLIDAIASDDGLLGVLNRIEQTPRPIMLFAGVQYLMLLDGGTELARHFPNFDEFDPDTSGLEERFRRFVLDRAQELVEIGRTRYTQTNECRRCVALLPAIWMLGYDRLHLVDLGTSAGLNLLLDRFRYRWDGVEWGPESPVVLVTENRGRAIVPRDLEIVSRTGLDLNPIDPTDPDERRWLEALIWPEHHDRRDRLQAALSLAGTVKLDLVAGDALETLGSALSRPPEGEPVVVMQSFALNQFTSEQRDRVTETIDAARGDRPVGWVSLEVVGAAAGSSVVEIDDGSGPAEVGRAQYHGEWIEFYALP